MDKSKIIKMIVILAAVTLAAGGLLRMVQKNSLSLAEYESLTLAENERAQRGNNSEAPDGSEDPKDSDDSGDTGDSDNSDGLDKSEDSEAPDASDSSEDSRTPGSSDSSENSKAPGGSGSSKDSETPDGSEASPASRLTGASLNGDSQIEERTTYEDGFYYEPISDNLRRYMTGISYPDNKAADNFDEAGTASASTPEIALEELRYVHILHYDFDGNSVEGELICNEYIAQDLTEIFYELYCGEYRLEKVLLIDEYDGDDVASMEDNNTSCFNYRPVAGSASLSRHAYGLAIDINPLYNPYITYGKDGSMNVSPVSGTDYADRTLNFPYKIDENDLCYKLFIQHGFTWGGAWNHSKDYQHFQKKKP